MDPTQVEQRDAERVDQAIQHLENGDVSLAYQLLNDVVTRAPASYDRNSLPGSHDRRMTDNLRAGPQARTGGELPVPVEN